jgi:DNA polymerase-1
MTQTDKHLYLIDGHALAYRAYFAMIRSGLSTAHGQPTGAVYGFTLTLLKLLHDYGCPYIAAVFDSDKPTHRKKMYEEYKANRAAMPDDLRSQIPLIFRLVEALNIPLVRKDGLEADDVIAHLVREARKKGYQVSIVTRDKDLMQLVADGVRMLAPESGGGLTPMGEKEVEKKMGVPPVKIADLLALMGDSSDNIPGVPGVGPKTAVKILEEVGTLAALMDNPARLTSAKLAEKIEHNRDKVALSRELVKLHDEVELDVGIEDLAARPVNREAATALLKELEFHTLLKNPLFGARDGLELTVHIPRTLEELARLVERIESSGRLSIDTETTSMVPREAELVGISLAVDEHEAWYVPVGHAETIDASKESSTPALTPRSSDTAGSAVHNLPLDSVLETLGAVIESEAIVKIGQNLKYDYQVLKNYGLRLRGIRFDSMVAAYLIDPGKRQYNMDFLAGKYLDVKTTPIEELIGPKGKRQTSFAEVPIATAAAYSGEDVAIPLLLMEKLRPVLAERNQIELFEQVEMPLVTVLAEMEWQGMVIDRELLATLSREYATKLEGISRDIFALAGEEFNLNSPKQIAEVFFGKLAMPKSKKTKTGLSTDVAALERLAPAYPIAALLLKYREAQKLLSTYIDALPVQVSALTGRLHSSLNQTITTTGRLSSNNPNLQNIPVRTEEGRRIRDAFIAPEGYRIVSADYSQIELRLLAHLSGDERLITAFEQDKDIHAQTASAIYGVFPEMVSDEMRRAAKTINFGLMYGMGPANLSRQLGISFREARSFIEAYFQQFPTIRALMDEAIEKARAAGYSETLLGRRRYLPDINATARQVREAAERTAINTPVQGTAADIIKIAMVNIHRELPERYPAARMLLQVHDELIFEVPGERAREFAAWLTRKMENAYRLRVRLKVEVGVGRSWAAAH